MFLVESFSMKMTMKKRVVSTLAVGAIAIGVMLAAPVAANATGNPNRLDRGDLTQACQTQNGAAGWVANLRGSTAYSWRCEYVPGGKASTGVNVNSYCMQVWGVWAQATNANDP